MSNSKPAKLGCVNAVGRWVTLFDADGKGLACTIDTPNAVAYAFGQFPEAVRTQYEPRATYEKDDRIKWNMGRHDLFREYMVRCSKAVGYAWAFEVQEN